jgi:hypothetical protein
MGFSESSVAGRDGNPRPMSAFDHRFSFDLHAGPPAQSRINDPSGRPLEVRIVGRQEFTDRGRGQYRECPLCA